MFGQVTLTFRYGREDEEVMGLKFCNEAVMCLAQLYPPYVGSDQESITPLQVSKQNTIIKLEILILLTKLIYIGYFIKIVLLLIIINFIISIQITNFIKFTLMHFIKSRVFRFDEINILINLQMFLYKVRTLFFKILFPNI